MSTLPGWSQTSWSVIWEPSKVNVHHKTLSTVWNIYKYEILIKYWFNQILNPKHFHERYWYDTQCFINYIYILYPGSSQGQRPPVTQSRHKLVVRCLSLMDADELGLSILKGNMIMRDRRFGLWTNKQCFAFIAQRKCSPSSNIDFEIPRTHQIRAGEWVCCPG